MKKQFGFIGRASALFFASLLVLSNVNAKTLKLAYDADPVTLDIHEQLSGGMIQLAHMTHDPLVRWTQELSFEPRLATKWERIDDSTVRFTLCEGVKFHSGNPMTAADVKWIFDRMKTSPDFKAILTNFKELKVVDDKTIELITDGPCPLVMHTATYLFPMDSKFYEDKAEIVKDGASFASAHTSGTGPYTVTSREQGVKVVFDRFADYWDKDSKGNIDQVVMTPIKDNQTRVAALLSGDVDFIAQSRLMNLGKLKAMTKLSW